MNSSQQAHRHTGTQAHRHTHAYTHTRIHDHTTTRPHDHTTTRIVAWGYVNRSSSAVFPTHPSRRRGTQQVRTQDEQELQDCRSFVALLLGHLDLTDAHHGSSTIKVVLGCERTIPVAQSTSIPISSKRHTGSAGRAEYRLEHAGPISFMSLLSVVNSVPSRADVLMNSIHSQLTFNPTSNISMHTLHIS